MRQILKLSLLVVAAVVLFGSSKPVKAQGFYLSDSGFSYGETYRPRYRTHRRKVRKTRTVRRRAKRKNAKVSRRANLKVGRYKRKSRRLRKRKSRKRKVASLPRRSSAIRKTRKKTTLAKPVKGPVQIVISLPKQRVSIYQGGQKVATARVSTGRSGHRTPPGVFSIIQKHKKHFSNLYNDAPMPFMQRITWSGLALHAGNVSRPYASHGCVRMPYGFAKKLFRRTSMGAHVIVASSSSSPRPIAHKNLFQPRFGDALLRGGGVQTAAYTDISTIGDAASQTVAFSGLPEFVKPVVAAAGRLEQKKQALESAIAEGPAFELTLAGAKKHLEERRAILINAKKMALARKKDLRAPRRVIHKIKRSRTPKIRALRKAEGRAKWAWTIVEKRRDNPKFEGNWMKMALARAASRDAIVVQAREKVDLITLRLDEAATQYDGLKDIDRKAQDAVRGRNDDLRAAIVLSKKARKDLTASRRAIETAKKELRAAHAGVKSALAREKMPLRILITPRLGRERIKDTQKLLAELGYDPGIADGKVGKNTRNAIKAFQRELSLEETGKISDQLIDDLYVRAGRKQKANAHMYVRQGFIDLFDVPVDVQNPDKALGTHVYTAMHFEQGAKAATWTALTVNDGRARQKKRRKGRTKRQQKKIEVSTLTAQDVLDRIKIPGNARRQISMLLTPGSSLVVSDKGMSHETGKGTDFVVLTK